MQALFLCVSAPPITSTIWQAAPIQQDIRVFCIHSGSLWLQLGIFSHLKSLADFAMPHSNSFLLHDYITPASPSLHYSVKRSHSLKLSLANHIPLALLLFHNKIMCPGIILHQMFLPLLLIPDGKPVQISHGMGVPALYSPCTKQVCSRYREIQDVQKQNFHKAGCHQPPRGLLASLLDVC